MIREGTHYIIVNQNNYEAYWKTVLHSLYNHNSVNAIDDPYQLMRTFDDRRKLTFEQAKEKALLRSGIWHVIKLKNEFIEVSEKALGTHKSLYCTNG